MVFAQKMLDRKLRPSPEFEQFFRCLIYFKENKHSPDNFDPWFKSLEKLLPIKTSRAITEYLAFSLELFKDNSINLSTSNRWYLSNNRFRLVCDSVPKVIVDYTDLTCLSRGSKTTIYGTKGIVFQ